MVVSVALKTDSLRHTVDNTHVRGHRRGQTGGKVAVSFFPLSTAKKNTADQLRKGVGRRGGGWGEREKERERERERKRE